MWNMQSGQAGRDGLLNNIWVQTALLAIVGVILVTLTAAYIW
jgi:hypothetical protein